LDTLPTLTASIGCVSRCGIGGCGELPGRAVQIIDGGEWPPGLSRPRRRPAFSPAPIGASCPAHSPVQKYAVVHSYESASPAPAIGPGDRGSVTSCGRTTHTPSARHGRSPSYVRRLQPPRSAYNYNRGESPRWLTVGPLSSRRRLAERLHHMRQDAHGSKRLWGARLTFIPPGTLIFMRRRAWRVHRRCGVPSAPHLTPRGG